LNAKSPASRRAKLVSDILGALYLVFVCVLVAYLLR